MTLNAKFFIAHSLHFAGRFEDALAIYREVVPQAEMALGNKHASTLQMKRYLGLALVEIGEFAASKRVYSDALLSQTERFGEQHPKSVELKTEMAWALLRSGFVAEAERFFREIDNLSGLGMALLEQDRIDDAHEALTEAIRLLTANQNKTPVDRFRTGHVKLYLGLVQAKQGDLKSAEVNFSEGYQLARESICLDTYRLWFTVPEAVQGVIECYEKEGLPEQAAEWNDKLADTNAAIAALYGDVESIEVPPEPK